MPPITFSSLICEAEGCFGVFLRLGDPDGLAGGMDTGRDGLALAGLLRSFTSIQKIHIHNNIMYRVHKLDKSDYLYFLKENISTIEGVHSELTNI